MPVEKMLFFTLLSSRKINSRRKNSLHNAVGSLPVHKVKQTSGPDWDYDGIEGTTQMRGLQNFGLRIAPQKKHSNMAAQCEGIPKVIIPKNGVHCPPYTGRGMGCGSPANSSKGCSLTFKRKGSQVAPVQEIFVKRCDRRQRHPLTNVLESSAKLSFPGFSDYDFSAIESVHKGIIEDMDVKSFLHPDSHVEESDFDKEALDETGFSSYLCHLDSAEQSMGVVTDQGVSKWQSKGKRNMRTLNKKHCESSNGSFLETSDACTALMHGIAFDDKVHSSEELRTKKVSNNTYEEPVLSEKGKLCFIFQCNAIKGLHVKMKVQKPTRQKEAQQLIDELEDIFQNPPHGLPPDRIDKPPELVGDLFQTSINTGPQGAIQLAQEIQAVMAIGSEWLLEVSKMANTSRDAFSALQFGLLSPAYLRQLFERMGATSIKLGQFRASTPTLFLADYVTEFQNCFDKAPAVPFQEIVAIIRVHSARINGSQKEVAFKVLKPGIEDFFIADLNFLYEVARIVEFLNPQISHTSLVDLHSIRSLFCGPEASLIPALNEMCGCFMMDGLASLTIVARISPNSRLKIMPDDEDMPSKWYNLMADLPEPPPPALNPETHQLLKLEDLFPLFPKELIMQEASQQRYIDIPENALEMYKHWRSTPLFRENKLEKSLQLLQGFTINMKVSKAFKIHPSSSDMMNARRFILSKDPNNPSSLGIAVSEAVEMALANADTMYSLGSVLNHVLLHETIIGEECIKQRAILRETPDTIVGCTGGGSNFAGFSFPFMCKKLAANINPTIRAVEPAACPSLAKGVYVYDYTDIIGMTLLLKMHSLGYDFIPNPIHAGVLCYHGMAPLISHVYNLGLLGGSTCNTSD
eukprot:Gb_09404 [translate_table: standard]